MKSALIDVQQEKLTIRVKYEKVTFDVFKAIDFFYKVHCYSQMDNLDLLVAKPCIAKISKPSLVFCHNS